MDRNTIGHYGWIVIVVIIICILIGGFRPVIELMRADIKYDVSALKNAQDEALDDVPSGVDVTKLVPGLYYTGTNKLIKSWDELISEGILGVESGKLSLLKSYNVYEDESASLEENGEIQLFELFNPLTLSGDLVISPDVSCISVSAFQFTSLLTGVVIPDAVTTIEDKAFFRCEDLKFVILGKKIAAIGESAFGFSGIKTLNIPSSVTSIASNAFIGCPNIKKITVENENKNYYSEGNCLVEKATGTIICACKNSVIPDRRDITGIGENVFIDLNIKEVHIPASIISIAENNFINCPNLKRITVAGENPIYSSKNNCLIETASKTLIAGCKNSIIPDDGSVTSIGDSAFYRHNMPSNLTINGYIKAIGTYSFCEASGIESLVIADGVESLADDAFSRISASVITLPKTIESIGRGAFSGCENLKEVNLSDGFKQIGKSMFFLSSLETITIPTSTTKIEGLAFARCSNLTDIIYEGTKEQWSAISFGESWDHSTGSYTVHCTDGDIVKS